MLYLMEHRPYCKEGASDVIPDGTSSTVRKELQFYWNWNWSVDDVMEDDST